MFSIERRERVAALLLDRARGDGRVVALARTGSMASGTGDRWSDVDLFLGVHPAGALTEVVETFSGWLYADLGAVHHFDLHVDLPGGAATYRALLLGDGLEVDLGVTGAGAFAALGDQAFEVVFDERAGHEHDRGARPAEGKTTSSVRASHSDHLVGLGWHHALHARAAIARDQPLQAEHWISALRDHATTLAAIRHHLPADYAKGADRLPQPVQDQLAASLVTGLDAEELTRARQVALEVFLTEVHHVDAPAAARLRPVIAGTGG